MKVYINKTSDYYSPFIYVFKLIGEFSKEPFEFVNTPEHADMIIDSSHPQSIPIALEFFNRLKSNELNHNIHFNTAPIICDEEGRKDYLTTIFYITNCFPEYFQEENESDKFGRFKYENSWQKRFNKIEENVVLNYIFKFLKKYKIEKNESFKSKFFVSHDIDTINGSFIQDGFWAIKRGRFDIVLGLLYKEIINKKEWRNIDKIIKLENEYEIKSTFFWLVNKGLGDANIKNADYSISKQTKLLITIKNNGSFVGLHKSCNPDSIDKELSLLPKGVSYNRHHFLHFSLPNLFNEIEQSKLNFDSSLGFAERYGFRNGFAMPFVPYNLNTKKSYNFVEMPLMVMDGSFQKYLKIPVEKTSESAINFFEKHRQNSYLSFLWHNTHFTNYKYKGYRDEFIKIVKYLYESDFDFITPKEIVTKILTND